MKRMKLFTLSAGLMLLAACSPSDEKKDQEQQGAEGQQSEEAQGAQMQIHDVSYAVGYNIGKILKEGGKELSLRDLVQGLEESYGNASHPRLSKKEVKTVLYAYTEELEQEMQGRVEEEKQKNSTKGREFAAHYEAKPGVVKHPSGLLMRRLEEGSGPRPTEEDLVLVDYTAKTVDGEIFYDTQTDGRKAMIPVGNVMKGWMIGLQYMNEGSTWELVVPPELAYGDEGVAGVIGPGETVIFKMTLHDVISGE